VAAELPSEIYASPIEAVKLARLGVERDRVVLRPAFFRQSGGAYGARAEAWCPLRDHDAPQAECSCGFYAVPDLAELWRLGVHEPDLAVVRVELAGRIIEHAHGYRAATQIVREVQLHGTCARCGRPAVTLRQGHFGGLLPSCAGCAHRGMDLATASESLGAPVRLLAGEQRSPRRRRLAFVLAQMLVPVLLLLTAGLIAGATRSGVPVTFGQLAIVAWLMTGTVTLDPIARRLDIGTAEALRLRRRWSPLVAAVTVACDFALTVGVIALWGVFRG